MSYIPLPSLRSALASTEEPLQARTFPNLSEAEEVNGQSRTYLGIHREFDKTEGILQGRHIADFLSVNASQRLTVARIPSRATG